MALTNRPWPTIKAHLQNKYHVVAEIDLVELDHDPQSLYQALKSAHREHYEPDDRILIYHYDTDYYYSQNTPGFTLTNLFTCLSSLDISINFCLLLTNHYGIQKEIHALCKNTTDMPVFESNYTLLQTTPNPRHIHINIESISKAYICLNGAKRSHRVLFLSYLKAQELLDHGILSWHFKPTRSPAPAKSTEVSGQSVSDCIFVSTVPFTRIKDKFDLDCVSRTVFNDHHDFFRNNYKDQSVDGGSNENRWDIPAVQQALLYVSVETALQYPYPYLTEKTFRAILHKRPFVIVGPPGSLAQIKKLGFKTFDDVWDESYDCIEDPNQRIRAVIKIVQHVCSFSAHDLQNLMYNMRDTVESNYQFYKDKFSKQILNDRLQTL